MARFVVRGRHPCMAGMAMVIAAQVAMRVAGHAMSHRDRAVMTAATAAATAAAAAAVAVVRLLNVLLGLREDCGVRVGWVQLANERRAC